MANEDLKAKMREALDKKDADTKGVEQQATPHEKAHGPEVEDDAAPRMHRRKAGGGGS